MNEKQILVSLNKIANTLDNNGLYKQANSVTEIMIKVSQAFGGSSPGSSGAISINNPYSKSQPIPKKTETTFNIPFFGNNVGVLAAPTVESIPEALGKFKSKNKNTAESPKVQDSQIQEYIDEIQKYTRKIYEIYIQAKTKLNKNIKLQSNKTINDYEDITAIKMIMDVEKYIQDNLIKPIEFKSTKEQRQFFIFTKQLIANLKEDIFNRVKGKPGITIPIPAFITTQPKVNPFIKK